MFDKLFILELANNHLGDVGHGLEIIREMHKVCKNFPEFKFGIKFQYRNLDTFLHPDCKTRMDIKYVKRFQECKLSDSDFLLMKKEAENLGFLTICTGFDEESVDKIEKQKFDIIKIASCSFTDWPLLERIVKTDLPIIASTASASLDEINRVVLFLKNKNKKFALMHCIGEYPTQMENFQLNQIDLLKKLYPDISIGFSTHEEMQEEDSIFIAISKGANIFERHVDIDCSTRNAYSSTPEWIEYWLLDALYAYKMCGVKDVRHTSTQKEISDLTVFKRGMFAKRDLTLGYKIKKEDVFFAFPNEEGQILANNFSKYTDYVTQYPIKKNEPILFKDVSIYERGVDIQKIHNIIKDFLKKSEVAIPKETTLELSHHYGLERFKETGAGIITIINREYAKKLLVLLPYQGHPRHYHKQKEETFHILFGSVDIVLDDKRISLHKGDVLTVLREQKHSFFSFEGCILEEVSSTHYVNDSFYDDPLIMNNYSNRKTQVILKMD